ncbi:MAG: hypothetical protein IPO63_15000 [Bacteroidetes bacterium]|nr:hypothetical protein [Bacteroidota bacterium]
MAKASCYINAGFLKTGYTVLKLVPDQLLLHGESWDLNASNYILADSTGLLFSDFNFSSGNQKISINGIAGKDTTAKLSAVFTDFEASQFNDILSVYDVQIGGVTNGSAQIVSVLGKPAMNANLKVKSLLWFTDTLGDAEVNSIWNSRENKIKVDAIVTHGGDKNISISGSYIFKEKGRRT